MNFADLWSWRFYFSHEGLSDFPHFWTLLSIAAGLLLASVVLKILVQRYFRDSRFKKIARRLTKTTFWFGLVGLFLIWMRSENVPLLSLRAWWLLYAVLFLLLYAFIWRAMSKKSKQLQRSKASVKPHSDLDPFLPGQKKKKKRK